MTNHADPLDKANEIAQMYADQGLADVQRRNKPEQTQRPDGTWPTLFCVSCEDDLPEGRLALGKIRCFSCQSDKEKSQRAYR